MPKKNNDYWNKRQEELQRSLLEPADKYYDELEKAYKSTIKDIEKEIAVWYQRFADNNGIIDKAEAKKILNNKELKELKWDVEQYIKAGEENSITKNWAKELENASARYHISRLDALKLQTQQKIEELYGGREDKVKSLLGDTYTEGSYRNAYEIAQKTGASFNFAKIDDNKLNKVLSKPWTTDNNTFSDRIWQNRVTLVNTVHQELIKGISKGSSSIDIAKAISKKMDSDLCQAQRLVVTESAFFASEAQKDCYNSLDVEKYQVLGALDSTTCSECGSMDGQVFDTKDMQEGINAPPFHPNCRCTTVPYFDDEFTEGEKRAARDLETGETVYVDDMSYPEWKSKFVKEKGQGAWDYYEKGIKNKVADKKQYEKYMAVLGKNAPKSLEEFQKIKYTNSEEWDKIKSKVQEELPKMNFDRMKLFVGTLSNRQTRLWYKYHDENIPNIIDKTKSLEEQAREACELRNTYRTQARDLMKDQEERKRLDSEHPNISFEELVEYKKLKYGLKGDAIYKDIIRSSQTTNKKYDKKAGLEE